MLTKKIIKINLIKKIFFNKINKKKYIYVCININLYVCICIHFITIHLSKKKILKKFKIIY